MRHTSRVGGPRKHPKVMRLKVECQQYCMSTMHGGEHNHISTAEGFCGSSIELDSSGPSGRQALTYPVRLMSKSIPAFFNFSARCCCRFSNRESACRCCSTVRGFKTNHQHGALRSSLLHTSIPDYAEASPSLHDLPSGTLGSLQSIASDALDLLGPTCI